MLAEIQEKQKYGKVLDEMAKSLDLTENQFKEAEDKYKAVGEYLSRDGSTLANFNPSIEPQGSFLYGTMVRPIQEDAHYDIDLICSLENLPLSDSQKTLKNRIGNELKVGRYESLLDEEGQRCWTLNYAEGTRFHMDILPSTPDQFRKDIYEGRVDESYYNNALRMTDTESESYESSNRMEWPKTNPKGYSKWFKDQMIEQYKQKMNEAAIRLSKSVEDVPHWKVKTPLQRAIQILKRHRDIMFGGDDEKPISIIITTLAAKAYRGESNVFDALKTILSGMEHYIEEDFSGYNRIKVVKNPVNPEENFADKWEKNQALQNNFYLWLAKAKSDLIEAFDLGTIYSAKSQLETSMGKSLVDNAYSKIGVPTLSQPKKARNLPIAAHREAPKWPVVNTHSVSVTGRYNHNGKWNYISDRTVIPTGCSLMFAANTSVTGSFEVFWQVVNTGHAAQMAKCLRGQILHSKTAGRGGLKQKEATAYKGTHWVECFIVQGGVCVARSGEFIVEIG
ncbi:MAG: nucleotidyltransferase [Balneola sp.]